MTDAVLSLGVVALLVVPFLGALAVAALGPLRGPAIRAVSLATVVIDLVLALILAFNYQAGGQQLAESKTFQPAMKTEVKLISLMPPSRVTPSEMIGGIEFHVGLDGVNIWLVLLTALLMVPAVLVSWTSISDRINEYYAWLLGLEVAMLGVFLAFDLILFYTFFELTLVPLFFLIGIWGGPQRQHAARKFFIYTLAGSLITLLGVLAVVLTVYGRLNELTFQIPRLVQLTQQMLVGPDAASWIALQRWIFVAMMAGFAIKVPLFPLHTWLPLAHVEAPTAGSVLLAGVLLKIGVYGFLRLCLPLLPDASLSLGVPLLTTLAVVGIVYGALCALAQDDIKKLVAYSSVSHLGYCMLGLFALNVAGISGSLLQMINHGLSTGGLFLIVGMLYERYHTRKLADYGGMAGRLKMLAVSMVFICLASIGLPGLNGFVGEMAILFGTFEMKSESIHGPTFAAVGAIGLLLGAWYILSMLRSVFFRPVKEPHSVGSHAVGDLNARELLALAPIGLVCLAIGVFPKPFFERVEPEAKLVVGLIDKARDRASLASANATPTAGVARLDEKDGRP